MISLAPVVRDDLDDLFALQVRADQRKNVAPSAISIAEFPSLKVIYRQLGTA